MEAVTEHKTGRCAKSESSRSRFVDVHFVNFRILLASPSTMILPCLELYCYIDYLKLLI